MKTYGINKLFCQMKTIKLFVDVGNESAIGSTFNLNSLIRTNFHSNSLQINL